MSINYKESPGYTEQGIFSLLKKDNDEALSLLVYRYYDDLFRYGNGLCEKVTLVEDVIQDLFCEVWQKRERLSEITFIKPYLFISLRNRIYRQLQREKRTTNFTETIEFNFDAEISPEDLIIKNEDKEKIAGLLKNYINQLSSRQKEAIYLRFYENLSYKSIADIMEITVPYLYLLIHKSVARLKEMMNENEKHLSGSI
jgi:RNA polymerase sigma factor (sigma-70 family)